MDILKRKFLSIHQIHLSLITYHVRDMYIYLNICGGGVLATAFRTRRDPSFSFSTSYTSAMPPLPSGRTIRYGPNLVSGSIMYDIISSFAFTLGSPSIVGLARFSLSMMAAMMAT